MNQIRSALALINKNRKAFITINVIFYGIVLTLMVVVAFFPDIQSDLIKSAKKAFTNGPLSIVAQAYQESNIIKAIILTFSINLIFASLLIMTIPSLIIPFLGTLTLGFRAVLWGLSLSPASPEIPLNLFLVHSITLILEGQGYILVMFAIYLHGCAFLWPQKFGVVDFESGYLVGLKRSIKIYPLVILTLLIAAIYESISLIYFIK